MAAPGSASSLPLQLYSAYGLEFFFGMAAAYWLRRGKAGRPWPWLIAGVVLFAASAVGEDAGLAGINSVRMRLMYGLPSAMIVLGMAALSQQATRSIPALLLRLGAASYSIYLFQFVFIGSVWQAWRLSGLAGKLPDYASFLLLAVAGIAGGVAVSRLVEYPLMALVRRMREPRPGQKVRPMPRSLSR